VETTFAVSLSARELLKGRSIRSLSAIIKDKMDSLKSSPASAAGRPNATTVTPSPEREEISNDLIHSLDLFRRGNLDIASMDRLLREVGL
jgi:hypothetical protein